tara:strand:- start:165 stop:596 length:432 start_codon:yes stop_codon:yes gene_type:complete
MENLATIKLTSGEELIAIVEEGPTPLEITVRNPVLVHKNNSALGPMLSVSHWLMFTKKNSATIKKEKIVALEYDLEDNTINHFKRFTKERGAVISLDEQNRLEDMISKTLKDAVDQRRAQDDIEQEMEYYESIQDPNANTTIH